MTDITRQPNDIKYELIAENIGDQLPEPPLRMLTRILRGRYMAVIPLAGLLAILGALIGWQAVKPVYQSRGLVRVEGALPAILYESQETRVPPMFDAYLASQVTLLKSREVLERAVSQGALCDGEWPGGPDGIAALQSRLSVRRGRGEQMISIAVDHPQPLIAQAAVNAVLSAFMQTTADPGGLPLAEKEAALARRQAELESDLQEIRQMILQESDQYGREAIERMHAATIRDLGEIDSRIVELELARIQADSINTLPIAVTEHPAHAGLYNRIALLQQQEIDLLAEIRSFEARFGAKHPVMRDLNQQLDGVRIRIDLFQQNINEAIIARSGMIEIDPSVGELQGLDRTEAQYQTMREQTEARAAELGARRVAIQSLSEQALDVRSQLSRTRKRLEELRVEGDRDNFNRISVASWGDLPIAPIRDRRRGLATAGAIFGLVTGVAIVFFIGLADPRVRFAETLESLRVPVRIISLLPDIHSRDPESEHRGARSIHQLRNIIELQCAETSRNVHTITSCGSGEGKTSLSLALGASFAAAGRRTLVIDADVARASLTRQLGLDRAPGLCEAIGPGDGFGQVHQTDQEFLLAMPIGAAHGLDPEDLSRDKLVILLDALRTRVDAIIIDTGPVLTSVEACLVSAVADDVFLLASPEQHASVVRATVERLEQVGANCAGVVLNRAARSDFASRQAKVLHSPGAVAPFVPVSGRQSAAGQPLPFTLGSVNEHQRKAA